MSAPVPVFMSGSKIGEVTSVKDILELARKHGIRRFVVYASVRGDGEVPVSPQRLEALIRRGVVESITIIRKEIAGASPSNMYSEALRKEVEETLNEVQRQLEDARRMLAEAQARVTVLEKLAAALEELLRSNAGDNTSEASEDWEFTDDDEEIIWEA